MVRKTMFASSELPTNFHKFWFRFWRLMKSRKRGLEAFDRKQRLKMAQSEPVPNMLISSYFSHESNDKKCNLCPSLQVIHSSDNIQNYKVCWRSWEHKEQSDKCISGIQTSFSGGISNSARRNGGDFRNSNRRGRLVQFLPHLLLFLKSPVPKSISGVQHAAMDTGKLCSISINSTLGLSINFHVKT